MKRFIIFKYTLVDDYKDLDNDHLRTPVRVFKTQIFELIKRGFTPLLVDDYFFNYDKLPAGNYFMITFEGNYEVNHQAIHFLSELGIPTIVFKYSISEDNGIMEGATLTSKSTLSEYESNKFPKIYLGDLPSRGEDLLEEDDLIRVSRCIPSDSKYFSYLGNVNPAINLLVNNKKYEFGFTDETSIIEGVITDKLNLPRINCSELIDHSDFVASLPSNKKIFGIF